MRASLIASVVVAGPLAFALVSTAAPRMDNVCKSVDRRGNVSYGDCAPPTTYKAPEAPPPVVETPLAPAAQPVAVVPPAEVQKPTARSFSAVWIPSGTSSRKTYTIAGVPLLVGGLLVAIVASISFVIGAFRVGLWWGLGCLFVAPVGLVYLIKYWRLAKRPFLVKVAGLAAALVGFFILWA